MWLSRALLRPIVSALADASGNAGADLRAASAPPPPPAHARQDMGPGTFTGGLRALAQRTGEGARKVHLDGPYGALGIAEPEHYRVVYLIAGGVGVTPMASLAQHLLNKCPPALERVHFVWTNRGPEAFVEWLPELKQAMLRHQTFRLQLFNTRTAAKPPPEDEILTKHVSEVTDVEEGFEGVVTQGRPDLPALLGAHAGEAGNVGVYVCGPGPLQLEVQLLARAHGYHCHTETFAL